VLACSLPGPVAATPDDLRPILENKNPEYKRKNRIAILNAQDISDPEDLRKPASFVEPAESETARGSETLRLLERSRVQINSIHTDSARIEERLSSAPVIEQTLKRYQEAGLEERLKEQSFLVREERVLRSVAQRAQPFKDLHVQLRGMSPIDRAFVSDAALRDLPGAPLLRKLDVLLATLEGNCERVANDLATALQQFEAHLASIAAEWEQRKKGTQAGYEKILRELQKAKIDGEEFLRLRRQIEEFRPLRERLILLKDRLREEEQLRRNFLAEWQRQKEGQVKQEASGPRTAIISRTRTT
jgi:hypothetical protein